MPDRQFADRRLAALYDRFHPPKDRDDFRFYLALIMAAESVLDVGCGTGALLRLAREAGHRGRLVGVDPAEGMLGEARKRPDIELVLGDVSSMTYDTEFDLVVMTGNAFQVLLEDDEIRRALSAIRRVLRPGGAFAFETRNPHVREWQTWTTRDAVEATTDEGVVVRMKHRVENPADNDLIRFTTTYSSAAWDEPEQSHSVLRFVDREQLTAFLTKAGFEIAEQFGDWDRSRLTDASREIITIARRPAGG